MRPRLTYANVVSSIALFLVLTGGAAYALDGSNTVFTDDIVNGEVKIGDVGQGAVATEEIVNNQVKAADIGDGEVKAADIANGQVTADELAANSVRSDEVADGQVRTQEIGNGQVQAQDLAPGVAPGASGARAWGLVAPEGTLLRSKQVTAVTEPSWGTYCIDPAPGIDPTTAVMVVGEDLTHGSTDPGTDGVSHVEWRSGGVDCPAGTMEVQTFFGDGSPRTFAETDFGGFNLDLTNQGFTFVIP
jgi:hypothetical protein